MKLVTYAVSPNEPCYGLTECVMRAPQPDGSTADRWVQDLIVIRGDQRYHYLTDFGPAEDFETVTPMTVPSLGEDTVSELQYLAEKNRHDDYWHKVAERQIAESTLIEDMIRTRFQMHELVRNRSQIGPYTIAQRNGYSRESAWRRYMDTRAERTGKRVLIPHDQ